MSDEKQVITESDLRAAAKEAANERNTNGLTFTADSFSAALGAKLTYVALGRREVEAVLCDRPWVERLAPDLWRMKAVEESRLPEVAVLAAASLRDLAIQWQAIDGAPHRLIQEIRVIAQRLNEAVDPHCADPAEDVPRENKQLDRIERMLNLHGLWTFGQQWRKTLEGGQ